MLARLKAVRRRVAGDLPPYVVCSDRTLRELAAAKPATEAALLRVHGFGPHKAKLYGRAFLDALAEA